VTYPAKIFLHYSQDELDKAYDQRVWAPDAAAIIQRYTANSAAVRAKYPPRTDQYGPSDDETLDIFAPAGASGLPVVAYIHGGAWRLLTKEDACAAAPTFVDNGVIYVALNFAVIPKVRLPEMAAQCRRALVWLHRNIARFGGDPDRIAVCGHSSGGHLAGVMLTTDWTSYGAPADLLKAGLSISGMYELHPVMLSARSSYVKISPEELGALSAMRHLDRLACPVVVAWGERESPEFKRQSGEFATALAGIGQLRARFELPGANHFQVAEVLNDPNSALAQAFLALIKA
jgi:arylformamidase